MPVKSQKSNVEPKYPIYVISKGRWKSRLTIKTLERMKINYRLIIEPQEHRQYAQYVDEGKILDLPFSNLGQGSIPARNWVWEHSMSLGAKRHWILDDNIRGFYRRNKDRRQLIESGVCFRALEDFVDRYENVALAGMQYRFLAPPKEYRPPFIMNTRIYSNILILNEMGYRWRGRYNEDTDLSLRALKDGWCTMLFFAFLADKEVTMSMTGGNTDELYVGDGRLKMAKSLQEQHPDVVRIFRRWGRWQHLVNYKPFEINRLKKRDDLEIKKGVNEYGLTLKKTPEKARVRKVV